MEENEGCEAAVKRGRVRVGPSQLAGRVNADRESSRGRWTEEGEEDKAGDGERDGVSRAGRVARDERAAGRRIGENRARLGFAMTNGRRGHSARRSYRSKRDYYVGLSVECLSRPGHLIRPRRGSFVFLVFQTRAALRRAAPRRTTPCRATPYFPFVRAIYRSPSPRPARSALSSIACSRLKYDTYWSLDVCLI